MKKNLLTDFPVLFNFDLYLGKAPKHKLSVFVGTLLISIAFSLMILSPGRLSAADDIPSPTPHIETIPTGSWIIAMDNTNQGISGVMNIKAYGLALEMLHANVPLKWIIKSGKVKDAVDMTVNASLNAVDQFPSQNFEGTSMPAWSYALGGATIPATPPANTYNGSLSLRLDGSDQPIMANVDISGFSNVQLSVAFAATGTPDGGEDLFMDISYDNGGSWTGTGSVKLIDGNNFNLNINNINPPSTVSANPYIVNIPSSATQISVRFRAVGLDANEFYWIDDVKLMGNPYKSFQFISGPMVISPSDTTAARTVLNSYNTPLLAAEKIKIYKTAESISADVRYTLTHKPYIAVYNDGGNQAIHIAYLTAAGIGVSRYQALASGTAIDTLSCFTFSSEPHWDHVGDPYTTNDALRVNNLKFFLETGGNFLAQCIAVEAFEEYQANNFQSTNGFFESGDAGTALNLQYTNSDIAIMQIHGGFLDDGGSLNSWALNTGSSWKSPTYKGIYFLKNVIGDAALDTLVHVSATKIVPPDQIGGNLTYLSGHNYDGSTIDQINGRRIYLNNLFVPALRTLPQGAVYPSSNLLCEKDTLKLFVNPPVKNSAGLTYAWTGPNGFTSALQNPVIPNFTDVNAGLYTVTLTMAGGCKLTYPAFAVNIKPRIGSVNATSALSGCINAQGSVCVLEVPTPLNGTGTWSVVSGPGQIGDINSTLTSMTGLSTSGVPTSVKWLVTTPEGCRDSSITVISPPTIDTTYVSKYANSYCLVCPVNNGGTYYYIDPNGKILSGITDIADGISIGETEFCAALTYALPGNPTMSDVPSWPTYAGLQPYMSRYWSVHTEVDGPMTVRLFFTDEELASLVGKSGGTPFEFFDVSGLYVSVFPDNGSTFSPIGTAGGVLMQPQFLRRGSFWEVTFQVTGSSTFYLHPIGLYGGPLPIELLSFTAVADNSTVVTSWSTASENNNDYFTVERSKDAIQFEFAGEVDGAGNSNTVRNYSFVDTKPFNGNSYYRLKQTDYNGTYSYSKMVPVYIVRSNFNIYPNPSDGQFVIELQEMQGQEVSVRIFDNASRQVYHEKLLVEKEQYTLNVDLKDFPAGLYSIICSVGSISRKKIITIQ